MYSLWIWLYLLIKNKPHFWTLSYLYMYLCVSQFNHIYGQNENQVQPKDYQTRINLTPSLCPCHHVPRTRPPTQTTLSVVVNPSPHPHRGKVLLTLTSILILVSTTEGDKYDVRFLRGETRLGVVESHM